MGKVNVHHFGELLPRSNLRASPEQMFRGAVGGTTVGAGGEVEASSGLVRGGPSGASGDMSEYMVGCLIHACQGVLDNVAVNVHEAGRMFPIPACGSGTIDVAPIRGRVAQMWPCGVY